MEVKVEETKNQPKEELSNVHVNLDDKHEPIITEKPKDEPKYVRLEDLENINKAINNTREHNNRKISGIEAKIDQLLKQPIQPVIKTVSNGAQKDELDAMLEAGDWRTPVNRLADERAEATFNKLMKQKQDEDNARNEQMRTNQLLEDNKKKVLERHKELTDEGSQKSEIFRQVIQEHPEYTSNPFGPVLAMRDMEDKLREAGVLDEPVKQMVNKEVARQARTNGTAVAKGASVPSSKTITLSKEQKDFCDANNIKYENFAKYASMLNTKKEVEA